MTDPNLTATTTFREWYSGGMGPAHIGPNILYNLHLIGQTGEAKDTIWRLRKDVFVIPRGEHGEVEPRELVAAYALYRRQIQKLGGEPSAYERPVKEWNA